MSIKILKGYQKLLLLLLAALGMSTGCDPFIPGGCEYGTPMAKFKISGRVTDGKTGDAIKNIGVISSMKFKYDTIEQQNIWDTAYTDEEGRYYTQIELFPTPDTVYLSFYDSDSTETDFYLRKDTAIYFDSENLTGGDDSWYEGETQATCDVKLDKNED